MASASCSLRTGGADPISLKDLAGELHQCTCASSWAIATGPAHRPPGGCAPHDKRGSANGACSARGDAATRLPASAACAPYSSRHAAAGSSHRNG